MSKENKLEDVVKLRKSLAEVNITTYGFEGLINHVDKERIAILKALWDSVEETYEIKSNVSVNQASLSDFEGKDLKISFNTGNYAYYENFSDFIDGNKLKIKDSSFYISELDYLHDSGVQIPSIVQKYMANLELIKLIKSIADFQKTVANNLELFFYKSENGLSLVVDYKPEDLISFSESTLKELESQFNDPTDAQERKQIFKNELIGILNKNGNTFKKLLENWEALLDSYKKSFELYLSGFSFEKIKTASIGHFQELTDKINQTIGKVSNYIFAVPIAFVLLLRYFDFEGENFTGDLLLLILGALFFILVWFVAFRNIDESIDAIEEDIDDFTERIKNNKALESVKDKLETFKNKKLKAQRNKVVIAKTVSILIFLIVIFAFVYIHFSDEILTCFNQINEQ
jgi:hypothetical protein